LKNYTKQKQQYSFRVDTRKKQTNHKKGSQTTWVNAGPGCGDPEVELDVFRQERGVAGQKDDKAETDRENEKERIRQKTPTRPRHVCDAIKSFHTTKIAEDNTGFNGAVAMTTESSINTCA